MGRWVVRAVSGCGGNRSGSLHAHCRLPVRSEVLDRDSPGGLGRLLPPSGMKSGGDPYVHSAGRQRWSWRRRAEEVETRAALTNAGEPRGYPVGMKLGPGALARGGLVWLPGGVLCSVVLILDACEATFGESGLLENEPTAPAEQAHNFFCKSSLLEIDYRGTLYLRWGMPPHTFFAGSF